MNKSSKALLIALILSAPAAADELKLWYDKPAAEWTEDLDDPQNTHRHVSHPWAVYPGRDINWREKDLFAAARQSLIHRGDGRNDRTTQAAVTLKPRHHGLGSQTALRPA